MSKFTSEQQHNGRTPQHEMLLQVREIEDLRRQLAEMQRVAREALALNQALTSGFGYEILSRIRSAKERFLPVTSRRYALYQKVVGYLHRKLWLRSHKQLRAVSFETAPRTPSPQREKNPEIESTTITPAAEWLGAQQQPPVVIAIPNWNRVEFLRTCLESILSRTKYDRYRICVFDQASSDGSSDYLRSLGNTVDAIFSSENIGFGKANNFMIARYPQWDIVFLNNDTEVQENWLESLVATAYKAENIGFVGSKLIFPDGRLQEAGSQVFQDGSARAIGRYEDPNAPQFNQCREVDYCSAACLYAKRAVLDRIGGFDDLFSPAYYEDADLMLRGRAVGFKTLYEPRSLVIHHEHVTSESTAIELMERNQEKFIKKWAGQLHDHQKNLWEAVSVNSRPKVLIIGDIVPAPDRSAGGVRIHHLIRMLGHHYHVVYAFLNTYGLQEYLLPLEREGISIFYPGYAKAVHNYELDFPAILANNDFKFVVCSLFNCAEKYLPLVREYLPHATVLVDTYDVHFVRQLREAKLKNDAELMAQAQQTMRRELAVYRQADFVITVTEADAAALRERVPALQTFVVPTIHALPEQVAGRDGRRDLLFVGGFSHVPNVDAVLYFCREVLPLILAEDPELCLHVVGNAPPAEIISLGSRNIRIWGYVPYLNPFLQQALVSVAPLRFGSGMKGKIAEAMSYGLPVVTTTIGAEGMNLQDGEDTMIADTPEDFATKILRLSRDQELWNRIAAAGRIRVRNEWSPEVVESQLVAFLQRARAAVSGAN